MGVVFFIYRIISTIKNTMNYRKKITRKKNVKKYLVNVKTGLNLEVGIMVLIVNVKKMGG